MTHNRTIWLIIKQSSHVPPFLLHSCGLLWSPTKGCWWHKGRSAGPSGRLHPDCCHRCGGFCLRTGYILLSSYRQDLKESQNGGEGQGNKPTFSGSPSQTGLREYMAGVESPYVRAEGHHGMRRELSREHATARTT